jgi:hypothetical protein
LSIDQPKNNTTPNMGTFSKKKKFPCNTTKMYTKNINDDPPHLIMEETAPIIFQKNEIMHITRI